MVKLRARELIDYNLREQMKILGVFINPAQTTGHNARSAPLQYTRRGA